MALDAPRAAPPGSPFWLPHPDEVSGGEPDCGDPDCARDRRQHDRVLHCPQRPGQTVTRRARSQARHGELGGRERRDRDARRRSGLLALRAAQRHISTDRGRRLRAPDAGARQRQLRRSRGNRLAQLFRDARRAPRQGTEFLRRRGSARHFGARRGPRLPRVAELLRWRREHRRTGGQLERRAGNGRRGCGGGFSGCVLCRTGRSLGAARWRCARPAADSIAGRRWP